MAPNRYLPPMRPLPKKNRYLEPTTAAQLPATLKELTALEPIGLVQNLLNALPHERLSLLGSLRERLLTIHPNRKYLESMTALLDQAQTFLTASGKLAVARERFHHDLETAAKRAKLEADIQIAELEAKLAHLRKQKRLADDTEND